MSPCISVMNGIVNYFHVYKHMRADFALPCGDPVAKCIKICVLSIVPYFNGQSVINGNCMFRNVLFSFNSALVRARVMDILSGVFVCCKCVQLSLLGTINPI